MDGLDYRLFLRDLGRKCVRDADHLVPLRGRQLTAGRRQPPAHLCAPGSPGEARETTVACAASASGPTGGPSKRAPGPSDTLWIPFWDYT